MCRHKCLYYVCLIQVSVRWLNTQKKTLKKQAKYREITGGSRLFHSIVELVFLLFIPKIESKTLFYNNVTAMFSVVVVLTEGFLI